MKLVCAAFTCVQIAVALAATVTEKPPTVAVVTALKGVVELRQANEKEYHRLTSTTALAVGDSLKLGKQASALLLRDDSPKETLTGERTVAIAATAARGKVGPVALIGKMINSTLRTAPMAVRSNGGDSPLVILAPRYSKVLNGRPQFKWTAVEGARSYTFVLLNANEDEILRNRTAETMFLLPASRILTPGDYMVEITALNTNGKRLLDIARFSVVKPAESAIIVHALKAARELALPEGAPNLQLFAALIEHAQLNEAEETLRAALKDYAEDNTLRLLLAEVYRRMSREPLQLKELEAAGVKPITK